MVDVGRPLAGQFQVEGRGGDQLFLDRHGPELVGFGDVAVELGLGVGMDRRGGQVDELEAERERIARIKDVGRLVAADLDDPVRLGGIIRRQVQVLVKIRRNAAESRRDIRHGRGEQQGGKHRLAPENAACGLHRTVTFVNHSRTSLAEPR